MAKKKRKKKDHGRHEPSRRSVLGGYTLWLQANMPELPAEEADAVVAALPSLRVACAMWRWLGERRVKVERTGMPRLAEIADLVAFGELEDLVPVPARSMWDVPVLNAPWCAPGAHG
ncbi:MAG: hypothetical protein Q4G34_09670 [Micrococcus sp.]|nr:hypothetical protein [Micrococcus sp.]